MSDDQTLVTVTVLFFAKARDIVGVNETRLSIESNINYRRLYDKLIDLYSLQLLRNTLVIAINEEYRNVDDGDIIILNEGDTIAIIPPISGG